MLILKYLFSFLFFLFLFFKGFILFFYYFFIDFLRFLFYLLDFNYINQSITFYRNSSYFIRVL